MMMFFLGVLFGIGFVLFAFSLFDRTQDGLIVVASDGGPNPRFRWLLKDCDGKTIAICPGSYAEEIDARRAAEDAKRTMQGSSC